MVTSLPVMRPIVKKADLRGPLDEAWSQPWKLSPARCQ
jgi:hypothetical protein